MDAMFKGTMLLIAAAFVIGVTVLAIVALLRGESIGKTLKMWIETSTNIRHFPPSSDLQPAADLSREHELK